MLSHAHRALLLASFILFGLPARAGDELTLGDTGWTVGSSSRKPEPSRGRSP